MSRVTLRFTGQSGADLSGEEASRALHRIGPTIGAIVGLDTGHDRNLIGPAPAGFRDVEALIDTGASFSCIDQNLAIELRLPRIGEQSASGMGGSEAFPVHLAQIQVPLLNLSLFGRIVAVKLTEGGQRHSVLLGCEFLKRFRMTYDGRSGLTIIENESSPLDLVS